MEAVQVVLDIDTESLSQREKWIIERLQGFRDLDLEIEGCRVALSSGAEPPSITTRPQEDDDPYVAARYREPLQKEWQLEIAATVAKHVEPKWRYVSVERVHKVLRDSYSDDPDEDYRIRDAADATRRDFDERVELTPTERAVAQHEAMQERVGERLRCLEHQKRVMTHALGQMDKHYPEWYELLWSRYVMGEKYVVYLMRTGMTEKFYRNERHRALQKFDKLAVGLR